MENYDLYLPTHLIFGRGRIDELPSLLPAKGSRILLAMGGGSIRRIGPYDKLRELLSDYEVFDFSGIEPNPKISTIRRAVELCKAQKIDFIVAAGGGSVIDAVKCIAAGAYYDGDPWDLVLDHSRIGRAIPFCAVLTLSATGSDYDNSGVIILAATNRPESLDPALTRPGRFDRRVPVELPDLKGREEILKVHAKKVKLAENVDFNTVARMASGASGAELANIVNEAALRAVRDGRKFVTQSDLEESIEVVIAGYQKKNAILTDAEKRIVAYHEIGHALVAAKQTNSAPVQKITIIPRTSGALGYTMQVEEGNHYLMNKEELENKIATLTGGRAAEEVVFGSITTGASNDIEQATKLARAMLTRYGMSKDFDMVALETVNNQYLGDDTSLACSSDTQAKIDALVIDLVTRQHEKAIGILKENRAKLDELADFLYSRETITGEEFMEILNK